MTNAVSKITLSSSRDIPFNKLVLSQSNVRRVQAGVSIEELANSIARRGLLQSLHVRPVLDECGKETGMFEVPAGGRRFRALELLVKQKRLNKTTPVPCVVGDAESGILIEEVSLVENMDRAPLHPLDQFRAFSAMREKGMTEEAIAAAFSIDVKIVKQRLRLVSVSPVLLAAYENDAITLEQLMAFTVTHDHTRQEQVWEAVCNAQPWQKEPYKIRQLLTEKAVSASDKRSVFVGLSEYEAAGGVISRDLFEADGGGWLQDIALLEALVQKKLKLASDKISEEGWKWVEVSANLPYGATNGLRKLTEASVDLTVEEQTARDAAQAEYDALADEYESIEEPPEDVDDRFNELEAILEKFDSKPIFCAPEDIAIAGAFVTIGFKGALVVDRGYVRPEDERPETTDGDRQDNDIADEECGANPHIVPSDQRTGFISVGGKSVNIQSADEDEEDDAQKPLSERLMMELTASRTLALRDAVANNPHAAMTTLLHRFVNEVFQRRSSADCLEVTIRPVTFFAEPDDLKTCSSAQSINERHNSWANDMPANDEELWNWLDRLDEASRMALLAHCVSFGVNALAERSSYQRFGAPASKDRLAQADRLARAVNLDMTEAGWRPTAANYLGRVSKSRILEAVREGVGDRAAQLIEPLKKTEMAIEAERLLSDSGWLPTPLRLTVVDEVGINANEGDALPDFLADDNDDFSEEDDEEEPHLAAAE